MSRNLIQRPEARRDLLDIAIYLSRASATAGDRFFSAVEESLQQVARDPGLGALVELENPYLAGLRCWPINKFKIYLMFYLYNEETVTILRILHGARDIAGLLGEGVGDGP